MRIGVAYKTCGYVYDEAGQLTSKTGGTGNESYTYDDNGNRASVGGQTVVTGLANRLTSDGTFNYVYDQEGNLVQKWTLDNFFLVSSYTYDHRNRLTSVTEWMAEPEAVRVTYTYDAAGRRVKRTVGQVGEPNTNSNQYYVYDSNGNSGDELSMSFGNSGKLQHRYLHGPADQVLVDEVFKTIANQQVSDEVLWQLGDHQGSVRDVMDNSGVVRKHVTYDAFGKITGEQFFAKNGSSITASHAEAVEQLFGYTGQERDEATKLQHHGNEDGRWYDPSIGRWLSEDVIDAPNLYTYVNNDPINSYDPTGRSQAGNPLVNLGKSLGSSIYTIGNNLLGTSPGRINEFIGLANNYSSLSSQISTLQSTSVQSGRFADVAQQARNRQLGALTSERAVTYGNATNLLNNLLYGAERVDIGYNPNATPYVTTGQALRDSGGYWSGVGEVGKGYGDAVVSTASGLYNVVRHPVNTAQGLATAVAHPILTGQAVLNDIYNKSQTLRGQGSLVGDALIGLATGGTAKAVKEAGLVGKITGKVGGLVDNAPSSGRGIWDLTPEARWTAVEQQLGKNLPGNFKTIDRFDHGIATSIKSLDLGAPTYAKPEAVVRIGKNYVDKVAGYKGGTWNKITIDPKQISGRAVDIAVPPNASKVQSSALQTIVNYGKQKGVAVNIVEIR